MLPRHSMQHASYMSPDTFGFKDRFDARFLRLCKFNIAEILLSKQEAWLVTHRRCTLIMSRSIESSSIHSAFPFDLRHHCHPPPNAQACLEAGSMGRAVAVPQPKSYLTITMWMWDETDSWRSVRNLPQFAVLFMNMCIRSKSPPDLLVGNLVPASVHYYSFCCQSLPLETHI